MGILGVGKYGLRQAANIAKYGEKEVARSGVTDEILDSITPCRRLSARKCELSDPKYFIEKFERETGEDFLPQNWSTLSTEDKVDYIVKDRYSKLVSHKIMGKIKAEPEEHLYLLNKDGDIVHYSKGNSGYCEDAVVNGGTSVHNHPGYLLTAYSPNELKHIERLFPDRLKGVTPFSESDITCALTGNETAFVVDSQGHKFMFKPSQTSLNTSERLKSDTRFCLDLRFLGQDAFPAEAKQIANIEKCNELLGKLEAFQAKQKKWGRLFYPNRTKNKLIKEYLDAKTTALSMEPFDKINQGLKELSQKYGHRYEQLS